MSLWIHFYSNIDFFLDSSYFLMLCVKKPGNAISETSKRFQSWSCVHGGFGCIKPQQKTLARTAHSHYTDGRHTENKHAGIAHRKYAHTDGTLYKTRTESTENTNGQKAYRKHARGHIRTTHIQHPDGRRT